jgi:hypothetical protein
MYILEEALPPARWLPTQFAKSIDLLASLPIIFIEPPRKARPSPPSFNRKPRLPFSCAPGADNRELLRAVLKMLL